MDDNYGEAMTDSQWAKLGDTVKIHHVYEWVFSGAKTGEIIPEEKAATYEGGINVTEKIIWKIIRQLSIQSWISSQRKLMRIRSPNTAIGNVISGMFWFFTYHFTLLPLLVVIPIFAGLGFLLPLISYRNAAKQTIVERLRIGE